MEFVKTPVKKTKNIKQEAKKYQPKSKSSYTGFWAVRRAHKVEIKKYKTQIKELRKKIKVEKLLIKQAKLQAKLASQ